MAIIEDKLQAMEATEEEPIKLTKKQFNIIYLIVLALFLVYIGSMIGEKMEYDRLQKVYFEKYKSCICPKLTNNHNAGYNYSSQLVVVGYQNQS